MARGGVRAYAIPQSIKEFSGSFVIVVSPSSLFYLLSLGIAAVLVSIQAPLSPPPPFATQGIVADRGGLDDVPRLESAFLNPEGVPPSVHAGSITTLSDGALLAAWFGGSREGAADVAIYTARFRPEDKTWSTPVVVTDRERSSRELGRHIRKLGNPVVYADSGGRVHLYYVTVSLGGWAGSSISYKVSENGGRRWSAARRLVTSPFLNISTLVKGAPLELESGQLLLPVYHEFADKFGEVLQLDDRQQLIAKYRMSHSPQAIQPWVVPDTPDRARAFYRRAGDAPPRVLSNVSTVSSRHWSTLEAGDAPNPGAAVSVIRAYDGSYLMAYNPQEGNRTRLALARSWDGLHWEKRHDLEWGKDGDEFSYPYLIRSGGGEYHLIYTWQRRRMRHLVFNQAWLESGS